MLHPAKFSTEQLLQQCELTQTRRGGPGGQHRNKTESAIVLTHLPTGIIGQAGERRSQHENRAVAIERLRINLALAIRTNLIEDPIPSELWKSKCRNQQVLVSSTHVDFPAILAEALDVLNYDRFEVQQSAKRLGVSTSQLVKLLKQAPAAFQMLNQSRVELGLGRLK